MFYDMCLWKKKQFNQPMVIRFFLFLNSEKLLSALVSLSRCNNHKWRLSQPLTCILHCKLSCWISGLLYGTKLEESGIIVGAAFTKATRNKSMLVWNFLPCCSRFVFWLLALATWLLLSKAINNCRIPVWTKNSDLCTAIKAEENDW